MIPHTCRRSISPRVYILLLLYATQNNKSRVSKRTTNNHTSSAHLVLFVVHCPTRYTPQGVRDRVYRGGSVVLRVCKFACMRKEKVPSDDPLQTDGACCCCSADPTSGNGMPQPLPSRLRLSTCLPAIALAQLFLRPCVTGLAVQLPASSSRSARSSAGSRSGPLFCASSSVEEQGTTMPFPTGSKPVKEMESTRPRLWIYDHCPYCVRPR